MSSLIAGLMMISYIYLKSCTFNDLINHVWFIPTHVQTLLQQFFFMTSVCIIWTEGSIELIQFKLWVSKKREKRKIMTLLGHNLLGWLNVDGIISSCILIKPVNDIIQSRRLDSILYNGFRKPRQPSLCIDLLYNIKEVMRLARMDAHESRLSW